MRTLLTVTGLHKAYGRQAVLDGLSFSVHERMRIALVGRNGSGKTTLLRIISGEEKADVGTVEMVGQTRLGLIRQNEVLPADKSTLDFLTESSGKPPWECQRIGARFGLKHGEMEKAPNELSGGYQMRVKLVRMLLDDPDLLLLDEPVNYLDLPTLMLLEAFLKRYSGSYIITSHDREVLQNLCSITWDISHGEMSVFNGDVETYLKWKGEQEEFARRTNKRLRKQIAHTQEFVDRFRSKASQASRAQSKMKHITRLKTKLNQIDSDAPTAAFRIACPPFVRGTAVECRDLTIGHKGSAVATGINWEFQRGAKVGIVGENGRGKSTLLKTLAGIIEPVSGSFKWWHKADIGYYSQYSEDVLNGNDTVIQALTASAPESASAERIMAAAGAFLFHGDDLDKTCGVLSGGEKARVRLARLALRQHNVLIMDEPTNHLDAETVEVLARVLKEYEGTVVAVSHARSFMDAFVERLFLVKGGTVREYHGTYQDYVNDLARMVEEIESLPSESDGQTKANDRKERARAERDLRRKQSKLEKELQDLEREKGKILNFFFENPTDYSPERQRRLSELETEITALEDKWLKLGDN